MHEEPRSKAQLCMADTTRRDDYRSSIHLLVGPEAVEITMHKAIACRNSATVDRLHDLYNNPYLELEHYSPDTFLDFVEFCYSGSTTTGSDTLCVVANYQNLAQLYCLAESLDGDTLANHCVDHILQEHEKSDEVPEAAEVALLWESAKDKPGLKALLADLWVVAQVDVMAVYTELPTKFVAMMYTTKGVEKPMLESPWKYYDMRAPAQGFEELEYEGEEDMVMIGKDGLEENEGEQEVRV